MNVPSGLRRLRRDKVFADYTQSRRLRGFMLGEHQLQMLVAVISSAMIIRFDTHVDDQVQGMTPIEQAVTYIAFFGACATSPGSPFAPLRNAEQLLSLLSLAIAAVLRRTTM